MKKILMKQIKYNIVEYNSDFKPSLNTYIIYITHYITHTIKLIFLHIKKTNTLFLYKLLLYIKVTNNYYKKIKKNFAKMEAFWIRKRQEVKIDLRKISKFSWRGKRKKA